MTHRMSPACASCPTRLHHDGLQFQTNGPAASFTQLEKRADTTVTLPRTIGAHASQVNRSQGSTPGCTLSGRSEPVRITHRLWKRTSPISLPRDTLSQRAQKTPDKTDGSCMELQQPRFRLQDLHDHARAPATGPLAGRSLYVDAMSLFLFRLSSCS